MTKNLAIIFLAICLLVSLSFIYKLNKTYPFYNFPVSKLKSETEIENPLYLLLFFSKTNCRGCLEIIELINQLKPPFIVYGIVPGKELGKGSGIKEETGAIFKLLKVEEFKKYAPLYGPSLMGVSSKGRILFLIPSIDGHKNRIVEYIKIFYTRAYSILAM